METIKRNIAVAQRGYAVDVPSACPICHRHNQFNQGAINLINDQSKVQVTFQCTYQHCAQQFFCYYGPVGSADLERVVPSMPSPYQFSDDVKRVSPRFIDTFAQAEQAYVNGLKEICGPGYRKAFEFLIKDYAISTKPGDVENIKKAFSGEVVNSYIDDKRVQTVAKRTLWLGNDETHYLKRWVDKDIDDLIQLIKLTAHWIDIEYGSKKYLDEMPDNTA